MASDPPPSDDVRRYVNLPLGAPGNVVAAGAPGVQAAGAPGVPAGATKPYSTQLTRPLEAIVKSRYVNMNISPTGATQTQSTSHSGYINMGLAGVAAAASPPVAIAPKEVYMELGPKRAATDPKVDGGPRARSPSAPAQASGTTAAAYVVWGGGRVVVRCSCPGGSEKPEIDAGRRHPRLEERVLM